MGAALTSFSGPLMALIGAGLAFAWIEWRVRRRRARRLLSDSEIALWALARARAKARLAMPASPKIGRAQLAPQPAGPWAHACHLALTEGCHSPASCAHLGRCQRLSFVDFANAERLAILDAFHIPPPYQAGKSSIERSLLRHGAAVQPPQGRPPARSEASEPCEPSGSEDIASRTRGRP